MPEHIFLQPKDISEDDSWGQFNIVDGGLALCKVCNCLEGGLATDCPGEKISYDEQDAIYKGLIDYKDGKGWVQEFNPTNLSWLYSSYIRFHGTDVEFVEYQKIKPEYFTTILINWMNKGYRLKKLEKKQ